MADDLPAILARPKRQSPLERILMGDEDRMAYGTGSSAEMADQPAGLAQLIIGLYNSLGETAKKAIGNSQTAMETGYYNPAPVVDAALTAMTGGVAGTGRGGVALGSGPIRYLPHSSSLAIPPSPSAADMMRKARIEEVPLAQIRGTQPKMQWEKFDAGDHPPPLLSGYADRPIAVRREDGEYLIFDGHHRAVRALNNKIDTIPMYVIDAKDYAPEFAGRKPHRSSISTDDLLKQLLGE